MTKAIADSTGSGYEYAGEKNQRYALKIGERYAVIKPNPEEPDKKLIVLFTKTGRKVIFKHSVVPRGNKAVAFILEGNPPIMVKCEEVLDKEPEGIPLLDLPTVSSGPVRTWLGTR
jgi:hypothetical protein